MCNSFSRILDIGFSFIFWWIGFIMFNCIGYILLSFQPVTLAIDFSFIGEFINSVNMTIDGVVCCFGMLLLFSTLLVVFFTNHYYGLGVVEGLSLNLMLVGFSLIVWVLTCTSGLISSLIWWDYLGLVSFFLILRNSNKDSIYSSFVVLLSSRLGDVALFCLIGAYGLGCVWENFNSLFIDVLLLLIVFSKSAVYPLSSWLIEAMRAPTSVSSLVHSATLVTAGVWFVLRYGNLFALSDGSSLIVVSCLVFSIYASGLSAYMCVDLKKIVAFSTCNNIGWCVFFSFLGFYEAAMCQLVIHGFLKCVCFVFLGCRMVENESSQIWQGFYRLPVVNNEFVGSLLLLLGLGGFPCYGVYFIKHVILSSVVSGWGLVFGFVVIGASLVSVVYIGRIINMLLILGNLNRVVSFTYVFSYWWVFLVGSFIFDSIHYVYTFNGDMVESFGLNGIGVVVCVVQYVAGFICGSFILFNWGLTTNLVESVVGLNYLIRVIGWVEYLYFHNSFSLLVKFEGFLIVVYYMITASNWHIRQIVWLPSLVCFVGFMFWGLCVLSTVYSLTL